MLTVTSFYYVTVFTTSGAHQCGVSKRLRRIPVCFCAARSVHQALLRMVFPFYSLPRGFSIPSQIFKKITFFTLAPTTC